MVSGGLGSSVEIWGGGWDLELVEAVKRHEDSKVGISSQLLSLNLDMVRVLLSTARSNRDVSIGAVVCLSPHYDGASWKLWQFSCLNYELLEVLSNSELVGSLVGGGAIEECVDGLIDCICDGLVAPADAIVFLCHFETWRSEFLANRSLWNSLKYLWLDYLLYLLLLI